VPDNSDPQNNPIVRAVEHAVKKQLRWKSFQIWLVYALVFGLAVVTAVTVFNNIQVQQAATQLKNDAIASCTAGNNGRTAELQVWDAFINLLLKGNTNATAQQEGAAFKKYLIGALAQRNCQQAYSNVTGDAAEPGQSGAENATDSFVSPSVDLEPSELLNWSGLCLSYEGHDVQGEQTDESTCSNAEKWVYEPATGQFLSAANHDLAFGVIGTRTGLVPSWNTHDSTLNFDDFKAGPGGFTYGLVSVKNFPYYVHAGGYGEPVGLVKTVTNGSYWAILGNAGLKAPSRA
jgi:hypothetical protein